MESKKDVKPDLTLHCTSSVAASSTLNGVHSQGVRISPRKKVAAPGLRSNAKAKLLGTGTPCSRPQLKICPKNSPNNFPKPLMSSGTSIRPSAIYVDSSPFGDQRRSALVRFSGPALLPKEKAVLEEMEAQYVSSIFIKTLVATRDTVDRAEDLGPEGLEKLRLQQAEERARKSRRDQLNRKADFQMTRFKQQWWQRVEQPHRAGAAEQGKTFQPVVTYQSVVNADTDPPHFTIKTNQPVESDPQPLSFVMSAYSPCPEEWAHLKAEYKRYSTLWDAFTSPTLVMAPILYEQFPWPVSYQVLYPSAFTIDAVRDFLFNPFWRVGMSKRDKLIVENGRWNPTTLAKLAATKVDSASLEAVVTSAASIYQILSDLWEEVD